MKLQYQTFEIEIIHIDKQDVIATSGGLQHGGIDNGTSGSIGLEQLFPNQE